MAKTTATKPTDLSGMTTLIGSMGELIPILSWREREHGKKMNKMPDNDQRLDLQRPNYQTEVSLAAPSLFLYRQVSIWSEIELSMLTSLGLDGEIITDG